MLVLEEAIKNWVKLNITDIHVKKKGLPMARLDGELILLDLPAKHLYESIISALPLPEDWKKGDFFSYPLIYEDTVCQVKLYKSEKKWTIALHLEKVVAPFLFELNYPRPFYEAIAKKKRGLYFIIGDKSDRSELVTRSFIESLMMEKGYHLANFLFPHGLLKEGKGIVRSFDALPSEALKAHLKDFDFDVAVFDSEVLKKDFDLVLDLSSEGHLVIVSLCAGGIYEAIERFVPKEKLALFSEVFLGASYQVRLEVGFAFETLTNTDLVKTRLQNQQLSLLETLIPTSFNEGMQSLSLALSDLVKRAKLSKEEALEKAKDKKALMAYLNNEERL